MATVELRTLGDCQIITGGGRIGPQSPNAFALALYLCMERGRPHARDELLPMFFPGVPASKGAHSLRQSIYKLRGVGLPCVTEPSGSLIAAASVRDDYSPLLATGELPVLAGGGLPGRFLPGYWPALSEEFSGWLEGQRDAIHSALRRAYVAQIVERRSVARWDQVERLARACLGIDPLNEEATLALAEALALSGSKAAGVRVLEAYVAEVGTTGQDVTIPATILKRRISERLREHRRDWIGPMLGREEEVRLFNELLGGALAGKSASLWISGEPGIGKTRLMHEFICLGQLAGVRVISASCQPYDRRRPMSVLGDVIPALLGLPGALGCSPDSRNLLNSLAPAAGEAPTTMHATFDDASTRITRALSDLLDAVSSECTVVLALDDVQWLDALSNQILVDLIGERKNRRLLILAGSREAHHATDAGITAPRLLHLGGLSRELASAYVADASSVLKAPLTPALLDRAVSLSAGNPLFLRYLAEHYATSADPTSLPGKLRDALEQRVRVLSPTTAMVLSSCALLGRHASTSNVEAVLEMPRYELARELAILEASRLITSDHGVLAAAHSLIADAVIAIYPHAALALLRRATAETLEAQARDTSEQDLYWAAYEQWMAVGDESSASECILQCARIAADLGILDAVLRAVNESVMAADSEIEPRFCNAAMSARATFEHQLQPTNGKGDAVDRILPVNGGYRKRDTARWLLNASIRSDSRWLKTLLWDSGESAPVRLRAASILMSLAECNADVGLAHTTFDSATPLLKLVSRYQSDAVRLVLAYNSVFGCEADALTLATDIRDSTHADEPFEVARRNELNAAEVFGRCGRTDESLALYDAVFVQTKQAGADEIASSTAIRAFWQARQAGGTESQTLWRSRSHHIGAEPLSESYCGFVYNETLVALDGGDFRSACELLDVLERRVPVDQRRYHRAIVGALRLRCRFGERNGEIDAKLLSSLTDWSLTTAPITPEDDVAYAVLLGTQVQAGESGAAAFLRAYHERRKRALPVLRSIRNKLR